MATDTAHTTYAGNVPPPGKRRPWWPASAGRRLLILAVFLAFSFAVLTVSAGLQFRTGVLLGAAGLGVTMFSSNRILRDKETAPRLRLYVPAGVVVAGGVLVGLWWLLDGRPNGLAFVGACLIVVGMGQLVAAWRLSERWAPARGIVVLAVAGAAGAVSLFGLSAGLSVGWLLLLVAGVFVAAPVGLSLLAEDVATKFCVPADRWPRMLLWFAGAACILAGVVSLARMFGLGFAYVSLAGLVVVLLIGAIAANIPVDVVIVAAVLALVWSSTPRGVEPDPERLPAEDANVIVAMGDSFMSGEGAPRFYEGTNKAGENECRRAPSAYVPVTVARGNPAVPDRLLFVACSGARAQDIHAVTQERGDPAAVPGGLNQLDHVGHLQRQQGLDVDLIVVSVGGNDAAFGEIAMACVAPGDCSEYGARWLRKLDSVKDEVHGAYQKIRARFQPAVPVLVVPYPIPLRETGCDWSLLTDNEHRFLHGYTKALNDVLERAARDAGFHYLAEMESAFDRTNLRICDAAEPDEAGVNFIAVNSVSGLIEEVLNPQNWFHNSMHPKENGHQAMADVLETWLENNPEPAVRPDPRRNQGPPEPPTIEGIMGAPLPYCDSPFATPAHCDGTVHDWTRAQLVDLAWRLVVPLGTLVLGAWLLWLSVMWWWRRWR